MNKAITLLGLLGACGICCALPALIVPLAALTTVFLANWKIGLSLLLALAVTSLIWRRFAGCTDKLACAQARRCGCVS